MEMEEEKDLPLLLGTPFLSTVGASIDFHKQEVILHKVNSLVSIACSLEDQTFVPQLKATLSSKPHEVTKVVKERVDKEPRVVRDKVEKDKGVDKGPRIEKPRLERPRVERPRSEGHELIDLFKHLVCLMKESLQALFDEPLGRLKKKGRMQPQRHLWGEKKDPTSSGFLTKPSQLTMTLFPTKFENGKIEYKIRYKGRSRPFSRAKALVTSEQSRDPTKLKELLSQVLTITLDGGTSSTNA
ncbi:unnamed protein product [Microthlaspi erraticum]|uniref:Uncharacterized protein n=1 Tax=Microthlaspi erraticum TaxID=1685480 RepID=A0A6D2KP96_9BRAS|nr:unnamed protein product [Microthlaspi erraticum]